MCEQREHSVYTTIQEDSKQIGRFQLELLNGINETNKRIRLRYERTDRRAAEIKYLEGLLGVKKIERKRNENITKQFGMQYIKESIRRELTWFGRLVRTGEGEKLRTYGRPHRLVNNRRRAPRQNWNCSVEFISTKREKIGTQPKKSKETVRCSEML